MEVCPHFRCSHTALLLVVEGPLNHLKQSSVQFQKPRKFNFKPGSSYGIATPLLQDAHGAAGSFSPDPTGATGPTSVGLAGSVMQFTCRYLDSKRRHLVFFCSLSDKSQIAVAPLWPPFWKTVNQASRPIFTERLM